MVSKRIIPIFTFGRISTFLIYTPNMFYKKKFCMKKYICTACEWVYDPAVGDPDGGIAPGTPFEDIPDDWVCPVCGLGKDAFEEVTE